MKKTLRINVTLDEFKLFINSLKEPQTEHDSKRNASLRSKYLTKAIEFDQVPPAWIVVINIISRRTGTPPNAIRSRDKINNLGVIGFTINDVQSDLNDFIRNQGGQYPITSQEMGNVKTVQDLYNLVEYKTP